MALRAMVRKALEYAGVAGSETGVLLSAESTWIPPKMGSRGAAMVRLTIRRWKGVRAQVDSPRG